MCLIINVHELRPKFGRNTQNYANCSIAYPQVHSLVIYLDAVSDKFRGCKRTPSHWFIHEAGGSRPTLQIMRQRPAISFVNHKYVLLKIGKVKQIQEYIALSSSLHRINMMTLLCNKKSKCSPKFLSP